MTDTDDRAKGENEDIITEIIGRRKLRELIERHTTTKGAEGGS